jgi:hypothetical protein
VKATNRVGSYWVIAQGLNASDRVVIEGLQKIKSGETVEPRNATLPPLVLGQTDGHGVAP